MAPNLTAPLSPDEYASLWEVGHGLMQRIILPEHREKLIALDYISRRLGDLVLTDTGRMRLAAGR